jgi:hypothetical protein
MSGKKARDKRQIAKGKREFGRGALILALVCPA